MAHFKPPQKSLLFFAIMYSGRKHYEKAIKILTKTFGPIKAESREFDFMEFSEYYKPEMGKTQTKKYLIFEKPIDRAKLAGIRLFTQKLEGKLSVRGKRTVNLDPGYITRDAIVFATLKERAHKIYLGKGVFADLQAIFGKNELRTFEYTFADVKANADFFMKVRKELILNNKNSRSELSPA